MNELNESSRGTFWSRMKSKGAKILGKRNKHGKNQWMEHSDGHPDGGKIGAPKHHSTGHVHATNAKGEKKIFPYRRKK
ncbi:MAG: hypothetical protein AAFO07_26215 [Bacteroidota bacterium]